MVTNGIECNSVLSAIARHERDLLTRTSEIEREAERIVAQARAETSRLIEAEEHSLSAEVSRIRKTAEEARESERIRQQKEAGKRLEQLRADAQQRAHDAVRAVVRLILPATSGAAR